MTKLLFLNRESLETALRELTCKEIFTKHDDVHFYYHNGIPQHWWKKEGEYFKTLVLELKFPGQNLHGGYLQVLLYWLSMKNLNIEGTNE